MESFWIETTLPTKTSLMKKRFLLLPALVLVFMLGGCSSGVQTQNIKNDSNVQQPELVGSSKPTSSADIDDYRDAIESNSALFAVNIGQHLREAGNTKMTRLDITNKSARSLKEVLIDLILVDDSGNVQLTHQVGVYSHIDAKETLSVYLEDFENQLLSGKITRPITAAYVVNYKENYFSSNTQAATKPFLALEQRTWLHQHLPIQAT